MTTSLTFSPLHQLDPSEFPARNLKVRKARTWSRRGPQSEQGRLHEPDRRKVAITDVHAAANAATIG